MTRERLALALYVHGGPTARAIEAVAWRAVRGAEIEPPPHILLADRSRYAMCSRIADRALRAALPAPVQ